MKIEALLEFRKLSLEKLKQNYKVSDSDIANEASYQKLKGLTQAHKPAKLPGVFYYLDNTVAMIYIGENEVPDFSVSEIFKDYGKGEAFKSRAGKSSLMHVYPKDGFAISVSHDDKIEFMEIFPSMSVEDYRNNIYKEVLFIR